MTTHGTRIMPNNRKRSCSQDESPLKHRKNPFLCNSQETFDPKQDKILTNLIEFADGSKERTPRPSFLQSAHILLDELQVGKSFGNEVSPSQVALLMLPWSIRNLLANTVVPMADLVLALRTLVTCLKVAVKDEDAKQKLAQKTLNQSTLFKLVPKVAILAVTSENDDESVDETEESTYIQPHASQSYQILVKQLYRPTMDVACNTLLIPVVSAIRLEAFHARVRVLALPRKANDEEISKGILLSTLELIQGLQTKGNPKTNFQLLASTHVLLALSKVYFFFQSNIDSLMLNEIPFFEKGNYGQELIREILDVGLFDRRHHLDGFRSMLASAGVPNASSTEHHDKKEQKFRFYQELLFGTLIQSISNNENHETAHAPRTIQNEVHSAKEAAWIIPILYKGFLEQSKLDENDKRSKMHSSKQDDIIRVNFVMFAKLSELLCSLFDSKSDEALVAMRSLHELLELLGRFDTYLPSHDDIQGSQFAYMDTIRKRVLFILTNLSTKDYISLQMYAATIHCYQNLFLLNHRLFHDHLESIITDLSLPFSESRLEGLILEFFGLIFDTYAKLRHQSHLVSAFVASLRSHHSTEVASMLRTIICRPTFLKAWGGMIRDSPLDETRRVFSILNDGIVDNIDVANRSEKCSQLCVLIDLLIVVTRNVRVDSNTAIDISSVAQDLIDSVVQKLIERSTEITLYMAESLKLFGWLIELHTNCAFWLGRKSFITFPSQIHDILKRICDGENPLTEDDKARDELLFLCCHRLRHLHSFINDDEILRLDSVDFSKKQEVLRQEAAALAAYAADICCIQRSAGDRPQWTVIAYHIYPWLMYAKCSHIDLFLNWIYSIQSIDPNCPSLPKSSAAYRENYDGLQEEIEVVRGLLQDASLFEYEAIASRIASEAVHCSNQLLKWVFKSSSAKNPCHDDEIVRLLHRKDAVYCTTIDETMRSQFMDINLEVTNEDELTEIVSVLNRCREPVMFAASFIQSAPRACRLMLLERIFALDRLSRILAESHLTCLESGTSSMVALRSFASTVIDSLEEDQRQMQDQRIDYQAMLTAFTISSKKFIENYEPICAKALKCATKKLLHSISVRVGMASLYNSEPIGHDLSESVLRFKSEHVYLCHGIISGISHTLRRAHRNRAELELFIKFRSAASQFLSQIGTSQLNEESAVFFTEWLIFENQFEGQNEATYVPEKAIFDGCLECLTQGNCSRLHRACSLALITASHLKKSYYSANNLVVMALSFQPVPVSHALFCQQIPLLASEEYENIVKILTSEMKLPWRPDDQIRSLKILLQSTNRLDHLEILNQHGKQIFLFALDSVHPKIDDKNSWSARIVESCNVLIEFIRRRELVVLQDRELALTLAHIDAVLSLKEDEVKPMAKEVIRSCHQVVLTMFQKYSKHLYTCVPSIISTLHVFLHRVLTAPLANECIEDRANYFNRLCEQVVKHKDIYKKHVLGLLLTFVNGLKNGMDVAVKENLLPGVFYLLDTLSTHEMKQLNAMMDISSKAFFRVVYKAYQKVHAFKGN